MHPELKDLNDLLIPLSNSLSREAMDRIDSGEWVHLASRRAVLASDMKRLREYQRRLLFALAAGQSTNTSYLIGTSAGAMHGMWLRNDVKSHVEMATRSGKHPPRKQWRSGHIYRRPKTGAADIVSIMGAEVLDPVSAWFDIACTYGVEAGLIAADCLLAQGFTLDQLMDTIVEAGRCHGVQHARKSLHFATTQSQSIGETRARWLLIQAGIKDVRPQAQVLAPYSVDLLVGKWLVIEIDGDIKYVGDPIGATNKERDRQKRMERMGYKFLRYSLKELEQAPERFVAEVREELRQLARMKR